MLQKMYVSNKVYIEIIIDSNILMENIFEALNLKFKYIFINVINVKKILTKNSS